MLSIPAGDLLYADRSCKFRIGFRRAVRPETLETRIVRRSSVTVPGSPLQRFIFWQVGALSYNRNTETQPRIGDVISRYRILERLGEGGMGVVYKAEDTNLRRPVALKFMHPAAAQQPEVRKRFRREAQASAVIDHPNVCHVYEFQENGDQMYIVMNYVEGVTLTDLLNSRPMRPATAVDIAIQIAQGLKAAHQKGIIHRDLKPGNIMITPEGVVKITDFGLAYLADRSRLTAPGTVMGTFAYMSPEQAQAKTVDRRSDLWAVGVLLYEMIAGSPPFRDSKGKVDLRAVVTLDPDLRPLEKVSPELERITSKLLRKDPAMRYQHSDDLIVDLRAVSSQLPESTPIVASAALSAGSATTVRAVPPVAQSHRTWVVLGLMVLAAVLIVVIYSIIY